MITTKLYLRNPKNEKSAICIEIRKDGERIRMSSEIIIPTDFWDADSRNIVRGCPDYIFLIQKLTSFNAIIAKEVALAELNDLTLEQLKDAIAVRLDRPAIATPKNETMQFYRWWAQNSFGDHHPTRQNWNHYVVFKEFLDNTNNGKDIPFESVDYEFYLKFKAFLDNNKGYKPNTTATHLRDLKAVMTEAKNRGMHNSTAYLAIKKKFENVDTVYLTMDEINKLYEYKLGGVKSMVRDLFVLGCHTAMRFQDYSEMDISHISNGRITIKTKKTDTTVIIPAHPRVLEILNKWGGKAPFVSLTVLNKVIKDICQEMKIFEQLVPVKEGRRTTYIERWNLISSHTARRSGATNMYLSGIPAQSIMKITGHTSEASFMKYLRFDKEENAEILAKSSFFNL